MTERRRHLLLLFLAFAAYVSLGLPDGVLGVAWPSIRHTFDLPVSQFGALLMCTMAGYLVSTSLSGEIVRRVGIGHLLTISSAIVVASLASFTVAPIWTIMLFGGVLAGLGAGAIDAGINGFAADRLSPRAVVWLHACYGIGAMLGPMLMTVVLTAGLAWRWGYAIVGAILLAMTVAFAATARMWQARPAGQPSSATASESIGVIAALRRAGVWGNIGLFFLYTGLESTAGQWSYSLFTESRGMNETLAGLAVTAYWGSLTAGRIACGFVANRHPINRLLRLSMIAGLAASLLVWQSASHAGNFVGLALLGFFFGPIYPLMIAETPTRLGREVSPYAIGFQVSASYLGIAAIPGIIGVLARMSSLEVIGPVLLVALLALFALHEWSAQRSEWRNAPMKWAAAQEES